MATIESWPEASSHPPGHQPPIKWNIKTEQEEYLSTLESKLRKLKANGVPDRLYSQKKETFGLDMDSVAAMQIQEEEEQDEGDRDDFGESSASSSSGYDILEQRSLDLDDPGMALMWDQTLTEEPIEEEEKDGDFDPVAQDEGDSASLGSNNPNRNRGRPRNQHRRNQGSISISPNHPRQGVGGGSGGNSSSSFQTDDFSFLSRSFSSSSSRTRSPSIQRSTSSSSTIHPSSYQQQYLTNAATAPIPTRAVRFNPRTLLRPYPSIGSFVSSRSFASDRSGSLISTSPISGFLPWRKGGPRSIHRRDSHSSLRHNGGEGGGVGSWWSAGYGSLDDVSEHESGTSSPIGVAPRMRTPKAYAPGSSSDTAIYPGRYDISSRPRIKTEEEAAFGMGCTHRITNPEWWWYKISQIHCMDYLSPSDMDDFGLGAGGNGWNRGAMQ